MSQLTSISAPLFYLSLLIVLFKQSSYAYQSSWQAGDGYGVGGSGGSNAAAAASSHLPYEAAGYPSSYSSVSYSGSDERASKRRAMGGPNMSFQQEQQRTSGRVLQVLNAMAGSVKGEEKTQTGAIIFASTPLQRMMLHSRCHSLICVTFSVSSHPSNAPDEAGVKVTELAASLGLSDAELKSVPCSPFCPAAAYSSSGSKRNVQVDC